MKKKIILVGPGASGKDYLAELLEELGYRRAVSCTTRPRRSGEQDGVAYHFITEEDFAARVAANEFKEWYTFGDQRWHYGTLLSEFEKADLFIMSPPVLPSLGASIQEFTVIFLNVPEAIRRARLGLRTDTDSADRRLAADARDFCDFRTFDIEITSPDFTVDDVLHALAAL